MKDGSIVYLCENEFSKFRQIHEQIKTSIYSDIIENVKIQNRFEVYSLDEKLNSAAIMFEDQSIDHNFYNCVPGFEFIKYDIKYHFDDRHKIKVKFTVMLNLLTVIL